MNNDRSEESESWNDERQIQRRVTQPGLDSIGVTENMPGSSSGLKPASGNKDGWSKRQKRWTLGFANG